MPRQFWFADVIADAFRGQKGFRVDVYPGWQNRGSTSFAPDHVMDHHTGAGTYNNLLKYMAEGPRFPPLCNIATSRPWNGVVRITIVAAGRANHAGVGAYVTIPRDNGNYRSVGVEHQNDGQQSWPSQQLEAARILDAALLRHMKRSTNYMLDHKTYAPTRKVDRHSIDVNNERSYVSKLMNPPKPKPSIEEAAEEMKLIHLDKRGGTAYVPDVATKTLYPLTARWQADAITGRDDWHIDTVVVPRADVGRAGWRIGS